MSQTTEAFDHQVRQFIYEVTMRRGYPPLVVEAAAQLQTTPDNIKAAFQRLAAGRVLVLQQNNGEILMANPFSAVPTPFLVELNDFSCFGNCIWDALGVLAMLKKDGRITTSCGDCGTRLEVQVVNGAVQGDSGLIHFAIPARHWWDDIIFN